MWLVVSCVASLSDSSDRNIQLSCYGNCHGNILAFWVIWSLEQTQSGNYDNIIKRFTVNLSVGQPPEDCSVTKGCLFLSGSGEEPYQLCGALLWQSRQCFATTIAPYTFLWVMLYLSGSEVPAAERWIEAPCFPQVLISPLGRSTKLETEADDRGGDLHSVVCSKSTPARGTRRQKPERVMELHLPP